jgi:hypothetical protein
MDITIHARILRRLAANAVDLVLAARGVQPDRSCAGFSDVRIRSRVADGLRSS